MIPLILSVILAFTPTIDGQRVHLTPQEPIVADIPYWLGVSCPPGEIIDLTLIWGDLALELDNITGTHWKIMYIDDYRQVDLYQSGNYVGRITPEPASIIYTLCGIFYFRRLAHKKSYNFL